MFKKILSSTVIICFFLTTLGPCPQAHADTVLGLPAPGTMVNLSPAYEPTLIKGLIVHKDNPFLFDFIVDTGHSGLAGDALKKEGDRLVKYFFACLTIPEKDLWVNLSPYEKDRMVPQALGQTALGRDLLAQDYILKQLTASLIYPEKDLGKSFWDRVYTKAQQMYGTTQIPVNTFNKVWIVADKASVYEHGQTAFVVSGHMKVMLEEDYLALQKHMSKSTDTHSVASQIVRAIILPEIEKEVNTGKNFATLRQIFNSLILASWYKKNLKEALLTQVYANKSTVKGVNLADPSVKQQIYQQYLKAYKKGVFNYIKEDAKPNGQTIPRKYFSGGFVANLAMTVDPKPEDVSVTGPIEELTVGLSVNGTNPIATPATTTPDAAMVSDRNIIYPLNNGVRIEVSWDGVKTHFTLQTGGLKYETTKSGWSEDYRSWGSVLDIFKAEYPGLTINGTGEIDFKALEANPKILKIGAKIDIVRNDGIATLENAGYSGIDEGRLFYTNPGSSTIFSLAGEQISKIRIHDAAMNSTINEITPAGIERDLRNQVRHWLTHPLPGRDALDRQIPYSPPMPVVEAIEKKSNISIVWPRPIGGDWRSTAYYMVPDVAAALENVDGIVEIFNEIRKDYGEPGVVSFSFGKLKLDVSTSVRSSDKPLEISISENDERFFAGADGFVADLKLELKPEGGFKVTKAVYPESKASVIPFIQRQIEKNGAYTNIVKGLLDRKDIRILGPNNFWTYGDLSIYFTDSLTGTSYCGIEIKPQEGPGGFYQVRHFGHYGADFYQLKVVPDGSAVNRNQLEAVVQEAVTRALQEAERFNKAAQKVSSDAAMTGKVYSSIHKMASGGTLVLGQWATVTTRTAGTFRMEVLSIHENTGRGNSYTYIEGLLENGETVKVRSNDFESAKVDAAMGSDKSAIAQVKAPGGIDLNTSNGMQWKVSKDGKGVEMNIDPAMIERIRREGIDSLSPVILRMTPVTSIWSLMGLQAPAK